MRRTLAPALLLALLLLVPRTVPAAAPGPLLDLAESVVAPDAPVRATVLGEPGYYFAVAVSPEEQGLVVRGRALAVGSDAVVVASGRLDAEGRAAIRFVPSFDAEGTLSVQAVTAVAPDFDGLRASPAKVLRSATVWLGRLLALPEGAAPGAGSRGGTTPAQGRVAAPDGGRSGAVLGCPGCVGEQAIADGSVTTVKLADGSVTLAKLAAGASPWLLSGNAGTDPASQFLGTTDAQALELRVESQRVLRLEPADASDPLLGPSPSVLAGHGLNARTAGAVGATIAGGGVSQGNCGGLGTACPNLVTDSFGTVGGGVGNRAGDGAGTVSDRRYATVAGGFGNRAEGTSSAVGGGDSNVATGSHAVVAGGLTGTAAGFASAIGGGNGNATGAPADYAVVGGGLENSAAGPYTTVPGGYGALASLHGQMAQAGGYFAVAGDAQASVYVLRGVTANTDSFATLTLDGGSAGLVVSPGRTVAFSALVVGRSSTGVSAAFEVVGAVRRSGDGITTAVVGPTDPLPPVSGSSKDGGAGTWSAQATANDSDDTLEIQVRGDSGSVVRWVAAVRAVEVVH